MEDRDEGFEINRNSVDNILEQCEQLSDFELDELRQKLSNLDWYSQRNLYSYLPNLLGLGLHVFLFTGIPSGAFITFLIFILSERSEINRLYEESMERY
ncbi:MAG: hypothetical protein K2X81_12755, partial [Candidatus Obscuribacterales bacterium]|nr:hypothetical protein [Candidatus Obscuribacterales bacterium]